MIRRRMSDDPNLTILTITAGNISSCKKLNELIDGLRHLDGIWTGHSILVKQNTWSLRCQRTGRTTAVHFRYPVEEINASRRKDQGD
jgi:hypothetical protein